MADYNQIVIPVSSLPASGGTVLAFQAPAAATGGGVTITSVSVVQAATTTGTVGYSVTLLRYGTAAAGGTPALDGTIMAALGGTADHWVSGVPKAGTIGADPFLAAGKWLAAGWAPANAGTPTAGFINIRYVVGRGES